jgi:hypothetical protein
VPKRPFALKSRNRSPEADGQKYLVTMLRAYLPDQVWWCAGLSGLRLPPHIAAEAKRMGMEKGDYDLKFLFPDGVTRYVEVKSVDGVLTPEQKRVRELAGEANVAVVRIYTLNLPQSWRELKRALDVWMAPLGLDWLNERESLQRYAKRRAA